MNPGAVNAPSGTSSASEVKRDEGFVMALHVAPRVASMILEPKKNANFGSQIKTIDD